MNVVKRVSSLQAPMERVVHHGRGQSVETSEICQHTTSTLRRERHDCTLNRRTNRQAISNMRQKLIPDTSTTYVSIMLSCGKNQWATSSSPIDGASWKRFRYFCSSSVTWRMSRLSIGRRPGVLVLYVCFREQEKKSIEFPAFKKSCKET